MSITDIIWQEDRGVNIPRTTINGTLIPKLLTTLRSETFSFITSGNTMIVGIKDESGVEIYDCTINNTGKISKERWDEIQERLCKAELGGYII